MDRMHDNPRLTDKALAPPAVNAPTVTLPALNSPTLVIPSVTVPGVRMGVLLGRGGMASVFEGWDEGFNPPRHVAVKLMSPTATTDPVFRVRFDREASLVAQFRHDNIVRVYSCGEINQVKYLVMEYLGGGTLAQRIERGRMRLSEALKHAAELADALAYSHGFGIIHRDLKPANVLFTADGKLVLTDFGIAKKVSAESVGLTHGVIGPPLYMSPEQALGETVSDRTDVYSLGLTLSDMLADPNVPHPPRRWLRTAEPGDLIGRMRDVPPAVTEIMHSCLQYVPTSRPTASEVAQRLRAVASARPKLRKRRGFTSLERYGALAAGVMLCAGLGMYGLQNWRTSTRTSDTPVLLVDAQPAATSLYVNGKLLKERRAELPQGTHQLIAVAPGYYGEVRGVVMPERSVVPINFMLQSIELPSAADYERFVNLAAAAALTATDLNSVTERTLRTALNTKFLRQQRQFGTLRVLEQDLQALSAVGDARATVATVLANGLQTGKVTTQLDDRLVAAANAGDAVASLFVALTLRERLRQAIASGKGSSKQLAAYCMRMRSAATQGWDSVAGQYLENDGCNRVG